jgi:hypothetical protein
VNAFKEEEATTATAYIKRRLTHTQVNVQRSSQRVPQNYEHDDAPVSTFSFFLMSLKTTGVGRGWGRKEERLKQIRNIKVR